MKIKKVCKIEGCDNKFYCKDMCKKHYQKEYDSNIIGNQKIKQKLNKKTYYKNNKEKLDKNNKKNRELHKEEYAVTRRQYKLDNKDKILKEAKIYYILNKDKIKEYLAENADAIGLRSKRYKLDHREEIRLWTNEYTKQKRKNSPSYKLRTSFSSAINRALRVNGGSKRKKSILQYIAYTIQELKDHLESLFEPWMTWDNWGLYNSKVWKDADQSTWVWNIDHITPHSTFKYVSMEEELFKQCWALSNLRPLSAKQNLLDGANRVRHTI